MYPRSITSVVAAAVLAVSAAESSASQTTDSTDLPKITTGPDEISPECYAEVFKKVFIYRQEPSGALGDVIQKSSLFAAANIPTSECALLGKIPATLHEEYFTFESSRSEWWKSRRRTDFSKWASTCTGTFPTTAGPGDGPVVTPYQSHSAFLDTYVPGSATTCEGVTRGPTGFVP
ncbi:hypothetical protein PG994_002308 [Apiospora phragmitis]|uniref:Uncharacterized protein n=1 Tax=Apiospora phragmitis TaxID=2905665 RepID=A0ABR1WW33_9PEZI